MSKWTQRQRVNRLIRNYEKRGYEIVEGFDEYLSDLTDEELREITPEVIQQVSYYKPTYKIRRYMQAQEDTEYTGQLISGEEGRALERRASQYKGQQTRKRKAAGKQGLYESEYRKAYREAIKDIVESPSENDEEAIIKGHLILTDVKDRLASWGMADIMNETPKVDPNIRITEYYVEKFKKPHHDLLNTILEGVIQNDINSGLSRYEAEDALAMRLEKNPEEFQEKIDLILYGSGGEDGDHKIRNEITELALMLKGGALSAAELDLIENYKLDIEGEEYEE